MVHKLIVKRQLAIRLCLTTIRYRRDSKLQTRVRATPMMPKSTRRNWFSLGQLRMVGELRKETKDMTGLD